MSEQLLGELLAAGLRLAEVQQHFSDLCGLKAGRSVDYRVGMRSSGALRLKSV